MKQTSIKWNKTPSVSRESKYFWTTDQPMRLWIVHELKGQWALDGLQGTIKRFDTPEQAMAFAETL